MQNVNTSPLQEAFTMSSESSGADENLNFSRQEMSQKPTIKIKRLNFQGTWAIPLTLRPQQEDSGPWSLACIVDELYLSLMNVKEVFCMINTNRKRNIFSDPKKAEEDDRCNTGNGVLRRLYEEQARYKMYRIPVFRPPPIFVVQLKHLDERLKKELSELSRETKDFVVREAVERIYERVDRRFFLLSVKDSDLLHWRLEK